jgi:hypothetical protein
MIFFQTIPIIILNSIGNITFCFDNKNDAKKYHALPIVGSLVLRFTWFLKSNISLNACRGKHSIPFFHFYNIYSTTQLS